MKNPSCGFIRFGLFFSACFSLAHADKYLIDEETDGILLNCAIAFVVLCSIFLILVIILSVVLYRRSKNQSLPSRKGYQVSYREREPTGESISGPFHGHGIYSFRPESSIYLPGRQSTYINNNPAKQDAVYENEGVVLGEGEKRDSPTQEKGQKDAQINEKTMITKTTYDNPAFENPAYQGLGNHEYEALDSRHDYEMLDLSTAGTAAKRE